MIRGKCSSRRAVREVGFQLSAMTISAKVPTGGLGDSTSIRPGLAVYQDPVGEFTVWD